MKYCIALHLTPFAAKATGMTHLGVDLPYPMTQLNVRSMTSSHASCPGSTGSPGLSAKHVKGSSQLPTGTDIF
jgi:hypothetical protein